MNNDFSYEMADLRQMIYIMAQCASLNAIVAGMQAENAMRAQAGDAPAYSEQQFVEQLNAHAVSHNAVWGAFRK